MTSRIIHIDEASIKNLLLDTTTWTPGSRVDFSDDTLKGYQLRVSARTANRKEARADFSAIGRLKGKPVRVSCGTYHQDPLHHPGTVSAAAGRKRALVALGQLSDGVDPRPQHAAPASDSNKYEAVAARFLTQLSRKKNRAGKFRTTPYLKSVESFLDVAAWRHRDIHEISKKDIRKVLERIEMEGKSALNPANKGNRRAHKHGEEGEKQTIANRALSAYRGFFRWCCDEDILEQPPTTGIKGHTETERERTPSDNELRILWIASGRLGINHGVNPGPLFRSLVLLGQRRSETAGLRHDDITNIDGFRTWTKDFTDNKGSRTHLLRLPSLALEQIDNAPRLGSGAYVFGKSAPAGFSSFKERLDQIAAEVADELGLPHVEPWRIHDLRRACATGLGRVKTPRLIISLVLNHKVGGVTGRYDRFDYIEEKGQALQKWSELLQRIIDPPANVKELADARTPAAA